MWEFYGEDLAYVHDVGHTEYARQAAPGILEILAGRKGLVLDLGCGSGVLSRLFVDQGFEVLGIDLSQPLLNRAIERVPEGRFLQGSIYDIDFPPCTAIVAVGEVLSYAQSGADPPDLAGLFDKCSAALEEGGKLVFDYVEPGLPSGRSWSEESDWAVLVERKADEDGLLERRIVCFREVEEGVYRRSEETHFQRVYAREQMGEMLRKGGFTFQYIPSSLPLRTWVYGSKLG